MSAGGLSPVPSSGGSQEVKSLEVEATANVYFELEDLGEVAEGESWGMSIHVSGADLAGSVVRGQDVSLIATVSRNVGSASLIVDTNIRHSGGTLPGYSSGVRVVASGTNVILQARVTNTATVQNAWWYTLSKLSVT